MSAITRLVTSQAFNNNAKAVGKFILWAPIVTISAGTLGVAELIAINILIEKIENLAKGLI